MGVVIALLLVHVVIAGAVLGWYFPRHSFVHVFTQQARADSGLTQTMVSTTDAGTYFYQTLDGAPSGFHYNDTDAITINGSFIGYWCEGNDGGTSGIADFHTSGTATSFNYLDKNGTDQSAAILAAGYGDGVTISVTSTSDDCLNLCGNATCEAGAGETMDTCYADCGTCGDAICTAGHEDVSSCYADCGTCGDSICSAGHEDATSCYADCGSCGNGILEGSEQCDDGNMVNGDMCSSSCTLEVPGKPDLVAASDTGVSDTDNITNDETPTFRVTCYPGATVQLRYYSDPASFTDTCGLDGTVYLTSNSGHNQYAARQDTGGTPTDLSDYEYVTTDTTIPTIDAGGLSPSGVVSPLFTGFSPTFSESVNAQEGGTISVYRAGDNHLMETVDVTGDLSRTGTYAYGRSYYVNISNGAYADTAGNAFAGLGDSSTWTFSIPTSISGCGGVIDSPGTYGLASDISVTSGNCITITSDGVTVEGNGHTISASSGNTAIYAVGNAYNVTVQNVTITGFTTAVDTSADTDAHTAGSITLDTVTATGEAITANGTGTPYNSFSNGGSIIVTDSIVGTLSAIGGDASNDAAPGGNVTVVNSTTGNIVTSGGTSYRAGAPGTVDVTDSIVGNIDTHGSVSQAEGAFASGGSVTITNSTTGTVDASGGNSTASNAAAGGTVTVVTSTTGNITVDGGDAAELGGNAGTLDIDNASSVGVLSCAGGTGNTPGTGCTPPSVVSVTPADNATGVGAEPTLSITFDHAVVFNAGGVLTILENGGATEVITLPDDRITGDGTDTISVDPSRPMGAGNVVSIQITGNTFRTSYSGFAGIANNTTWNFTIDGSVPSTPVSAPDLKTLYDTGSSSTDNITTSNTPVFTASCTSGNTVKLYKGGTLVDTQTCPGGGSVDLTSSVVSSGTYSYTYTLSNMIGESDPSPSLSVTVDRVAPTVTLSAVQTSPTNSSTINMTVQFSETVTGFVIGDITVTNGTKGSFVAVDGDTYTFNITSPSGTVSVDVAGGVAADTAGNNNSAATQFTIDYDATAPALSSAAVNGSTLTLTYDSALNTSSVPDTTDFTVLVDGAPVTVSSVNVTGSAVTITLSAAVTEDQTVFVSYAPGADPIEDSAGNNAASLSSQSVTVAAASSSSSSIASSTSGNSPATEPPAHSGGGRGAGSTAVSGQNSAAPSASASPAVPSGAQERSAPDSISNIAGALRGETRRDGSVTYAGIEKLLQELRPVHRAAQEPADSRLEQRMKLQEKRSALRGVVISQIVDRFAIPVTAPDRSPFRDVTPAHPFYQDIDAAKAVGLVTGDLSQTGASLRRFRPDEPISAMELFILVRRLHRLGYIAD